MSKLKLFSGTSNKFIKEEQCEKGGLHWKFTKLNNQCACCLRILHFVLGMKCYILCCLMTFQLSWTIKTVHCPNGGELGKKAVHSSKVSLTYAQVIRLRQNTSGGHGELKW